tara:strand:+ start:941 stop:1405 length:465 start_codon:yes stop_codon:yes gene_type:complete
MKTLERFEGVKLYSVKEAQLVIEVDSHVPSLDFTIAEKRAIYEFFPSEAEAQNYIQSLREGYMSKNPTLQLITKGPRFEKEGSWLDGIVEHHFAHSFEINHSVKYQTLPLSELSKNIEALLNNPERRIIMDKRNSPDYCSPKIPKPNFDKIVLF